VIRPRVDEFDFGRVQIPDRKPLGIARRAHVAPELILGCTEIPLTIDDAVVASDARLNATPCLRGPTPRRQAIGAARPQSTSDYDRGEAGAVLEPALLPRGRGQEKIYATRSTKMPLGPFG
jgi:hypothetical protein